jgi:hypothetical protein
MQLGDWVENRKTQTLGQIVSLPPSGLLVVQVDEPMVLEWTTEDTVLVESIAALIAEQARLVRERELRFLVEPTDANYSSLERAQGRLLMFRRQARGSDVPPKVDMRAEGEGGCALE